MSQTLDLIPYGISVSDVRRNVAPASLYEDGLNFDGAVITSSGAMATLSAAKTGQSPQDKRVVDTPDVSDDIWWGSTDLAFHSRRTWNLYFAGKFNREHD